MAQQHDDYSDAIALGLSNKQVWPQVEKWCKHLRIVQTSRGMLAVSMRLPIGLLAVKCPHGVQVIESTNLDHVAREFIKHNCIGCKYHEEINSDNFGRKMLAAKAAEDAETAERLARQELLRQEAIKDATTTLGTTRITEGSVNRIILALLSRSDDQAGKHLQEAARLGPEFFSDTALSVLTDHFAGEYIDVCVATARAVCRYRRSQDINIPVPVWDTTTSAIKEGNDSACELLADEVDASGDISTVLPLLSYIIAIPNYRLSRGRSQGSYTRERPQYPGAFRLLRALWRKDPIAVQAAYISRLQVNDKDTRLNTAKVLLELLPELADAILPLVPALLRSLELADNRYEGSADAAVCTVLCHLYAWAPQEVEQEIDRYYPVASNEVRSLLLGIYAGLANYSSPSYRTRWNDDSEVFSGFEVEKYALHIPRVIERLYSAAGDILLSAEHRRQIYDSLESVLEAYPEQGIAKLDSLLSRLAMTIREANNIPQDKSSYLASINTAAQEATYTSLIRQITHVIDGLIEHDSIGVFPKIRETLDGLDSATDERLKSKLVETLGVFAQTDELVPQVIPQLYKHLVDFQSLRIRATAIRVVGGLLTEIPFSVPDEMTEILFAYLDEDYVIIHQSVVRALEGYTFKNDEQGAKCVASLLAWEETYFQKGDTEFLRTLFSTLSRSSRNFPRVRRHLAVNILPRYARHQDILFAEDMLDELQRRVVEYPEAAPAFVAAALDYFLKTRRDQYNDDTTSDRYRIWERLFELPAEIIAAEQHRIADTVRAKAQGDFIESMRLLELLAHQRQYGDVAMLASEAFAQLDDVRANAQIRGCYLLVFAAARAEDYVRNGDTSSAMNIISQALESLAEANEIEGDEDE